MPAIHEVATLTSKGQITLPKPIRQALGVDAGGKVAFDLRDGEVIVTRADAEHEDPAIGAFLSLLARDIEAGRNVHGLPEDLARALLEQAGHGVKLDEEIAGEVALCCNGTAGRCYSLTACSGSCRRWLSQKSEWLGKGGGG